MKRYDFFKVVNKVCEESRKRALKEADRIASFLTNEYNVKEVILFGSTLKKGCFSSHSDIDIAVSGLKDKDLLEAYGEILVNSSFKVDLILTEKISEKFKQMLKEKGLSIYERG
ncbi:MAG: nucleotidyltransferase domain-containing protein [bacterium]